MYNLKYNKLYLITIWSIYLFVYNIFAVKKPWLQVLKLHVIIVLG